jgi:hypothetical protein
MLLDMLEGTVVPLGCGFRLLIPGAPNGAVSRKGHSGDLTERLLKRLDGRLSSRFIGFAMVVGLGHLLLLQLADQVVLGVISSQLLLVVFSIVNPLQLGYPRRLCVVAPKVGKRAHLSVHKGISEDKLLAFKHARSFHLRRVRDLVPLGGYEGLFALVVEPLLKR